MTDPTRHSATEPGSVMLSAHDVAALNAKLARAHDWDAAAAERADARIELCGLLDYLIGSGR